MLSTTTVDTLRLEIVRLRALRGPNYWRLAPVIACDLRLGALEKYTSADLSGFTHRLLTALPTLQEHPCSRGHAGGFVERLTEGTGWPHILEHVALELQNLAGCDVEFGRVVPSGTEGIWWMICEYEEEDVGLQATRDAAEIIGACINGVLPVVNPVILALGDMLDRIRLGPSTAIIVEEARRRGIPVRRLDTGSLVQLGLGKYLRRIRATACDHTSIIAADIAQDKDLTKRVLQNVGLAVPVGTVARSVERAVDVANEIGYPVILKPLAGNQGRDISAPLMTDEDVHRAWADAPDRGESVIVERCCAGRDHRVLVIDGKVVAVAERVPAQVVGNDRSTIRELIDDVNRDPRRGRGHGNVLTAIRTDAVTEAFLARHDLTLDSVPAAGQVVVLRPTANLSTGGTSIDRTDDIHPDNITACEMAADVVGLDIAGLDVLTPDIGVPFKDNGAVIIEVNAAPGIRMHTHPTEGKSRNVAAAILDLLYPADARITIPVIAVTGTNGKTTTTRLLAHLFRGVGKRVGWTTTDGVYLQSRLVVRGDMTGPFAANVILSNPTVDIAVLETARGGILRAGLGFEHCDVGIVLNVSADHLGLDGIETLEQLADVKGVIPAVVKRHGYTVLNADDPLVLRMANRTRGEVVLFSTLTHGTNPDLEEHVTAGGTAAAIQGGEYVIRRGRLCIPIAPVHEVPLTVNGLAHFQHDNVLAAIAAAYVQGMRYEDIRAGLLSFFPSAALTPGRLNFVHVPGGTVLVDYAHNPAAVEGLMDLVGRLDAERRIGVVAAPGDRRDEDLRAIGRQCAVLDYTILKEDDDRRGREPGATACLLAEGLVSAGVSPDRIELIFSETKAVTRALELMRGHDLVIVLACDVTAVLEQVRRAAVG